MTGPGTKDSEPVSGGAAPANDGRPQTGDSTVAAVERLTGVTFHTPGLALRALTHSSYANESPDETEDYERLEFLGDAVLDYLAAFWLYNRFPELPEGDLTRLRSALVRTETLAGLSRGFGLDGILRIGKGERQAGGQNRETILCGAFEALVGALVLDQGIEAAYAFLDPIFQREGSTAFEQLGIADSKSLFQEMAQARFGLTPGYRVVDTSGPDHNRCFTVEVLVGKQSYGRGTGNSKQSAAQAAARMGLEKIRAMGDTSEKTG
jgi:ribonuclease III